jgi:integrase
MRGDGRIYRRGGRWWIQYWVHGVRHREPAQVLDTQLGLPRAAKTPVEARRALQARRAEILGGRFIGLRAERVTIGELLDALRVHGEVRRLAYAVKLRSHLKPVREFFGPRRAVEVGSGDLERYQQERLAEGKKPATVNRELEGLRRAFNHAAKQNPPRFPRALVPTIPRLQEDNVRQGFVTRAEIEALLAHVADPGIRDFIEWGFRTGMRKREISLLEWRMLDRTGEPWVLNVPAGITKNRRARALGLQGEVKAIIERRLEARRLDTPRVFHRVCKGKPGQPIYEFWEVWKAALIAAKLPPGILFHDLRRSAVRTLVRAGVPPEMAMKVSGHRTASMLSRYNIISAAETAAALTQADHYLSAQPARRNIEEAQFSHSGKVEGPEALAAQGGVGSSGRIRTYDPPVNSRMLYR